MKTYETYKDSGIEWLGQIPGHWEIVPMKRMFSFGKGLPITKADLVESGQPVISYGQIHSKQNPGTHIEDHLLRYVPSSLTDGYESSAVSVGDFIFADTSEDLEGCGNAVYIDREGIYAGYHAIIAKSKRPDNKYFAYLFLTDLWRSQIRSMVFGVKVYSITRSVLSQASLIIPPLSEQEVIASYLDYKIGQVDLLLAEKEKQMKDLQQYRMSLISETVTHGLNPDVKMKESGVEWLGRIPEHWTISKLARKYSGIGSGITPSTDNFDYYSEEGYNWLQTGDLSDGIISSTSKKITPKALQDYKLRIYPLNSIVVAMYGATIAKLGFLNIETTTNQACCVIPPTEEMDSKFSFYSLYASKQSLINKSSGGGQPNISQHIIRNHIIPVPPLSEQQAIASFLDEKTARIDSTMKELETQIADLRCYKTSVITEAVTGKVDVRQWKQT